jgi:hypothetical protein
VTDETEELAIKEFDKFEKSLENKKSSDTNSKS